ncbi:unnamed protein product [Rhizophagus irregularis]|nr:unnamed protein product [Rhizophagus irregularis]
MVKLKLLHLEVYLLDSFRPTGIPNKGKIPGSFNRSSYFYHYCIPLYLANLAHSILTPTECKAFKLIQDKGDWKWYYTPNLKQRRNCYQKVKQDDDSEVSQKNTNTFKLDKKHKKTKRAKKIDKSLDSIDKFMVLADIRSMLRKLRVS